MNRNIHLIICILGVYSMFIIWAISQESLSKTFNSPIFLQLTQSTLSVFSSSLYLRFVSRQNSPSLFPSHSLSSYLLITLSITLSPVFAFASLRHISYPTMVLAKSCKLIPTMLINVLLYRTKFKPYKYLVVFTLTTGIFLFMYQSPQKTISPSHSNSFIGLLYLFINLLLDGFTNSTQDSLFARNPSLTGQQMMFSLSILSSLLSLSLLLLPSLFPSDSSSLHSLSASLSYLSANTDIIPSLLQYALTNALGQLFIFETLHHFGSLTLITLTLTRKLFTMLLSVIMYNHKLSTQQWIGTAIVFAGIAIEALFKRNGLSLLSLQTHRSTNNSIQK